MSNFDIGYLAVMADMAGCPNRCRHCWLGNKKNGQMRVEEFKSIATLFQNWRNEQGQGIAKLSFFSWWREPDFRDDYRQLWALEQELSTQGCAKRFELLSTWRLARDESYAAWATTLPTKACQITFFGMEKSTDWGMRRRGAFRDQIMATKRCQAVGITPRWQLFLTKRCLSELEAFLNLIKEYEISSFFIGGMSPEGCGFELEEERLEQADLALIPDEMVALSRDGLILLGMPENKLIPGLLCDHTLPDLSASLPCLAVDADYNVYPNIAEPTEWWRLGNLKTDGIDALMKAYCDGTTPGMITCKSIRVSDFAQRYGNPNSTKLYDRDDLIRRFLHQWGVDCMYSSSKNR